MKQVIKLTSMNGEPILIGVEPIISVKLTKYSDRAGIDDFRTKIESRGAINYIYVLESVEEIYELLNQ